MKKRLDEILVERNIASDLKHALAVIMSGAVRVGGQPAISPGRKYESDADIEIKKGCPFVSRGGLKLDDALTHFGIDVGGRTCLDVGASTGGFTDCLISRGAKKVYALDVGKNLLHEKLRENPKVVSIENVNFRYFDKIHREYISEDIDFAAVDVSFISLKKIAGVLYNILKEGAVVLALVKPQFELKPDKLVKGISKDAALSERAVADLSDFFAAEGFKVIGIHKSSIRGRKGNAEYFIYLIR